MFGLLIIVGAIWGLLTATRLLRGEEDAGRWELFLAGRTTRRHAAAQAIAGLAAGFVVLWTLTAAFTVVAGSRSERRLLRLGLVVLRDRGDGERGDVPGHRRVDQPARPTRRQANGLAAAAFAVCRT